MPSEERPNIFVSYAREDKATAGKLVAYLRAQGWSVYWDDDLKGGDVWPKELETKLAVVKCIIVLWSHASVVSEWVREEASFGRSRQVLVAARLDNCELPFGATSIHADDLTGWTGDIPPAGIVPLSNRIRDLLADTAPVDDRTDQDKSIREAERKTRTDHISVSNHEADRDALLDQLGDTEPEIRRFITNGYSELSAAQYAARHIVDDRAPEKHYAAAAEHFKNALEALGDKKLRSARDKRPIEYFLAMERANSLAYSEAVKGEAHAEAIAIYERLSEEPRYRDDAPISYRLGVALARSVNDERTIQRAIWVLLRARRQVNRAADGRDELLREGRWLQFEIAKQLGYCNYLLSMLPGITPTRSRKFLDEAIVRTREAIELPLPAVDPDDLISFTVLKAKGNLIWMLAQKLRDGRDGGTIVAEIRSLIQELKAPEQWAIAINQLYLVDSIAFGAATIGDWATAEEEAQRNVENFASLAVPNGLDREYLALQARAQEILFFARLSQKQVSIAAE